MQQELERLFAEVPFLTIEEVINENDEATYVFTGTGKSGNTGSAPESFCGFC